MQRVARPWEWQVWDEQGLCRAVGLGAAAAPTPLGAPFPIRVNTHTRGWATSGTTTVSSVAFATGQEAGRWPGDRDEPFHQIPGDHAAVPRWGELHLAEGPELAYAG